ncbi:zonular occludens toxin family protein [Methylophaga sp.]|uniref:zonular occludens toxin family protein n=1 Tax=Methylophaga sp. TaxID=2024840 RepID=UPI00271BEBD8|nr:zonular occludens toxin domain-containing protein [Methylophaga sp.]MDO8827482.1 zonular occludens toxin domain-containing protein [Methylophaga sp.]
MINLITGTPGSGKTAYALDFMLKSVKEGRALYVHGIPDLKLPHIVAYCDSPSCDVCTHYTQEEKETKMMPANEWHKWAPDGAVMFFDEAQNIYRPRSSGAKVPENVAAFEVHRHKGLDFFLITQSPRLIDSNVRALVSRHIHLRVNWKGRKQFEWPETKDNPQSTSDAVTSSYTLNKKIFPLYKSASLHTKQQRKIPPAVFFAIAVVCVTAYSFYRVFSGITAAQQPGASVEESGSPDRQTATFQQTVARVNPPTPSIDTRFDFRPTFPGILESAPAYASIVTVKDFPRIAGCISRPPKCTCYTQQGTVYPTTPDKCNSHINSEPQSFNPYIEPQQIAQSEPPKETPKP